MTVVAEGMHPIVLVAIGFLLVGLVAAALWYRRTPSRRALAAVVTLAVGLATASGLYAAAAYRAYELNNTWHFGYQVDLEGNGSAPESVIVPVPQDEGLLAGLHLSEGVANWSFVDTPHGRGLFVQFTRAATVTTLVSQFPPPASTGIANPSMTSSGNCTAMPSNCTGPPRFWLFYSGSAGVQVTFSAGGWYVRAYPTTGWGDYAGVPPVPGS